MALPPILYVKAKISTLDKNSFFKYFAEGNLFAHFFQLPAKFVINLHRSSKVSAT